MAISSVGSNARPGVCTSTTRPTTPFEGQLIYETDTNRVLVWEGAAWVCVAETDSLQINSDGIVQTLLQPRFLASRSSDYSYNAGSASGGNPVVFNQVTNNITNSYNNSTGIFTAPVAGTYMFQAGIYQSGAGIQQLWWVINGSRERSFVLDHTAASVNLSGSGFLYLNAGDTVGVVSWSGGSNVTIIANFYHTYFRGVFVG